MNRKRWLVLGIISNYAIETGLFGVRFLCCTENIRKKGMSHISVTQRGKKFMKKCSLFKNNYSI